MQAPAFGLVSGQRNSAASGSPGRLHAVFKCSAAVAHLRGYDRSINFQRRDAKTPRNLRKRCHWLGTRLGRMPAFSKNPQVSATTRRSPTLQVCRYWNVPTTFCFAQLVQLLTPPRSEEKLLSRRLRAISASKSHLALAVASPDAQRLAQLFFT